MNLRTVVALALSMTVTACSCGDPNPHTKPNTNEDVPRPDAARSTVEVTPSEGLTADGIAAAEIRVTVRDATGQPMAGQPVRVDVVGDGAQVTAPGETDAAGVATGQLRSTEPGSKVLTVTVGSGGEAVELRQRPSVTFVAPQLHLAFTSGPRTVEAGESFGVAVEVLDGSNTRVLGADLTVSLSLLAAPEALKGGSSAAAASGVSTFEGLSIERAGTGWVLRASAPGVAPVDSAPFDVLPGGPDETRSLLTVSPLSVTADGTTAATVTVEVADAFGNPLADVPVALAVGGTQNLLSIEAGTTDSEGTFTSSWTSTVAEQKTLTASVGAADPRTLGPVTVTFVPGDVAALELTATPADIVADGTSSSALWARAVDAHGNPVPGATLAFAITGATNAVTPATVQTDSVGEAAATAQGTTSGSHLVTVSHGAVTATAPLGLYPSRVSVGTPTSTGGAGCLELAYTLTHPDAPRADVRVEYERGGTWHRATQAGATTGSGVKAITTSATGAPHTFSWNTSRDLPLFSGSVPIRITASTPGAAEGTSSTVNVQIDNGLEFDPPASIALGTQVPAGIAQADLDADGDVDLLVPGGASQSIAIVLGSAQGLTVAPSLGTGALQPEHVVVADLDRDGTLDLALAGSGAQTVDLRMATSPGVFGAAASSTFTLGAAARGLATADFDRNGTPDLLALTASGHLEVFARQAGGTFAQLNATATGGAATALTLGDVDRDGSPDAIVAGPNGVSLWKAAANAAFTAVATHAIAGGASKVITADFDRDGWLDVAALHAGSAHVSVISGTAAGGTLGTPAPLTAIGAGLLATDVDGDGDLDLLVSHASGVELLANDGSGALAPPTTVLGSGAGALAALDVDRDGRMEIVAARPAQSDLALLHNQTAVACQPSFEGAHLLPTGDQPTGVVLADFDRDGRVDLAVAEKNAGTVGLRRGRGDGTFEPAVTVAVGTGPKGLARADLNADGIMDLLVANEGTSNVGVLLGDGAGSFSGPTQFTAGPGAHQLVVGRFDADAHLDVITINSTGNTMTLLPGDGQGGLGAPVLLHTFTSGAVRGIAAGDFDADGDLDVAVTSGPTANLMQNDGAGAFTLHKSISVGTGPEGLALADLDGDGVVDLVSSTGQMTLRVEFGSAAGTFTTRLFSSDENVTALSVVDLDDDGDLDVLAVGSISWGSAYGRSVTRFLNDGTGTLTAQAWPAGYGLVGLDVADLDGDGALDVATTSVQLDRVSILPGDGQGGFLGPQRSPVTITSGHTLTGMQLTDLNGDGRPDAVSMVSGMGSMGVQLAQPGGGYGLATFYPVGASPQGFTLADFNHDGHLDAAVGTNSSFSLLLGDGAGGFGAATQPLVTGAVFTVAAADFDRDGFTDVAVVTNASSVRVWFGAGDGTFPASALVGGESGIFDLLAEDLDRDGWVDLIASGKSTHNAVVYKNPRARGGSFLEVTVNMGANSSPTRVALADVDQDGWKDLVTANGGTQPGASWAKVGPGLSLTFMERWTTSKAGEDLTVADLDGDGAVEILLPWGFDRVVTVIDTGTDEVVDWAVGVESRSVGVQDVNRDGRLDLVSSGHSAVTCLSGQ